MRLNRRGTNRWVILTRSYAFKFPALYSWRAFLYGLLNNMNERSWWEAGKPLACPVLWGLPGGFLIVMPRCEPLSEEEFKALKLEAYWFTGIAVEAKPDSFGKLNGLVVAVDYGWK